MIKNIDTFVNKARLFGIDLDIKRNSDTTYTLRKYNTSESSVVIPDFITQIATKCFKSCSNLTTITFPPDLDGTIPFIDTIKDYNIPKNITEFIVLGKEKSLIVNLEHSMKDVTPRNLALTSGKHLTIKNSHLINYINCEGFTSCTIPELRLITCEIKSRGLLCVNIGKLFLSKYSVLERGALCSCSIKYLYYYVETQEEADEIKVRAGHKSILSDWIVSTAVHNIIPVIIPNLKHEFNKLYDGIVGYNVII